MIKKIIKLIEQVYPKYLVLLVLIPVIIGYVIDFDVSDKYGIFSNLLWIPIVLTPFFLTKKKVFYLLVVIFYFIIGVLEITHWLILKGPLSVASLLAISNTNFAEASEFVGIQAISLLLFLIPYFILFYLSLINFPKKYTSKYRFFLLGNIFFLIGLFLFIPTTSEFLVKGTPQFARVSYSFASDYRKYSKAIESNVIKNVDAKQITEYNQQLFVLIIGESGSRNHMSLYKYRKETNPKLKKRNDIIVFDNVVSPYSNTIETVMSIITESNLENKLPFHESKDLIDVFHSVGFKTFWLSNQPPFGWAENLISSIGSKATTQSFVNTLNNSSYESNLNASYDEKLFEPFTEALKDMSPKKFIVLHLMGSHLLYDKRYPKEFDVFKGKTEESQFIAQYDNSILYNDFVIDRLFHMMKSNSIKNTKQIASAIYLSDHGENVYDEDNTLGHHAVGTFPKSNVEIPLLVWLSPTFKMSDSTKVATMKSNKQKPFVSDDIFHTILDLNMIESPLLEKSRSLFNVEFNDKRIRVLSDGKDYDKKIRKN